MNISLMRRVLACFIAALLMMTNIAWAVPNTYTVGDRGESIKEVQRKLKKWGYYTGAVDGIFGADMEDAVKKFQRKYGLTADGKIGEATARKMGVTLQGTTASAPTGTSSTGKYTANEVNLLAHVVHGEARGESYTGKVAVAAVVLNRVASSKFPNTISGVVYQPYAFTAVADGQINLAPDDESIRAARDAMNGWDPTNGAIYYYNPDTATSPWIFSRPVVAVIGRHRFCV